MLLAFRNWCSSKIIFFPVYIKVWLLFVKLYLKKGVYAFLYLFTRFVSLYFPAGECLCLFLSSAVVLEIINHTRKYGFCLSSSTWRSVFTNDWTFSHVFHLFLLLPSECLQLCFSRSAVNSKPLPTQDGFHSWLDKRIRGKNTWMGKVGGNCDVNWSGQMTGRARLLNNSCEQ